jgi:Iap family predicted aminopeptidase
MPAIDTGSTDNVVCKLEGATSATVIVGAHYDKTKKGKGIADNWTGVSMLPYLYAEMAAHGPQHTFVFVGFAEEEIDSAGAYRFVDGMTLEEIDNTVAMINLDTLGLAPMQVDSRSSGKLKQKLNCAAHNAGLEVAPHRLYRWITGDWEPFAVAGIPTLNLHSLSLYRSRLIHSSRDTINIVDAGDYYNSFRLVRQMLLELDASIN